MQREGIIPVPLILEKLRGCRCATKWPNEAVKKDSSCTTHSACLCSCLLLLFVLGIVASFFSMFIFLFCIILGFHLISSFCFAFSADSVSYSLLLLFLLCFSAHCSAVIASRCRSQVFPNCEFVMTKRSLQLQDGTTRK